MDPVLIEVPERIETERLILRCPRPGDGPTVNEAERETRAELRPWMPWAHTEKSLDDSEAYCRRMQARYLLREDLAMFIFERDVMGREGRFLGGTGLHRIDWSLRGFEIGYWRRTGCGAQGYVTEAVRALARFAFDRLGVGIPFYTSAVAVFLFSIYLIVDTQLVIGKHSQLLELDDYILGALLIYLDIIQIFLELLRLMGGRN